MSDETMRVLIEAAVIGAAEGKFGTIETLREIMERAIAGEQWAINMAVAMAGERWAIYAAEVIDRHREAKSAVAGLLDRLRPAAGP